ncbi:MAG: hypothetical protein MJ126_10480 [Lachnospiraceae bacterium]|nr:hypothetical protein [Lachnospiraceae bacterium]
MKGIKEISKDLIIAGLGTIDSQNEEIKDLLRRGSEVLGVGHVENEELRWNGNKDRLDAKETDETSTVKGIEITLETSKEVKL